jgi:hypothetical protein
METGTLRVTLGPREPSEVVAAPPPLDSEPEETPSFGARVAEAESESPQDEGSARGGEAVELVPGKEVEVVDGSTEVVSREATLIVSGELALRGGPRQTLREAVTANSDALADAVVQGAVGRGSVNRGQLALSAIREADPAFRASVRGGIPRTPEEVAGLSLAELRTVADALGIER